MRGWTAILLAFALAGTAAPAAAQDCRLPLLASVDMTLDPGKGILIPVSIEGTSKLMIVDTGSPISGVDPNAAQELHLITHPIIRDVMYASTGEAFREMAIIHTIGIGQMQGSDMKVLVWPSPMWNDERIAGTLGADVLRHYDIDLDFAGRKVGLFSQDHCPGKVVYWQAPAVAVVPMHVVNSGHIVVPVMLDGKSMDAMLDTGAFATILSLETAQGTFGLDPSSPGMTAAGKFGDVPVYRHTFHTLALEGITIVNPNLFIWDDQVRNGMQQAPHTGSRLSDATESEGKTDFTLGMDVLRHLHIYIAYNEQKLYISAAAPAPVDAANSAGPPPAATSK